MELEENLCTPEHDEDDMPLSGMTRQDSDSTWYTSEGPSQDGNKDDKKQLFLVNLGMILSLFS